MSSREAWNRKRALDLKAQKLVKLEGKKLAFAEAYCEHGDAYKAYADVYGVGKMLPNTVWQRATALLHSPAIAIHLTRLREEAGKNIRITSGYVTENLVWAINLARACGDAKTVGKLAMDVAKLHGLVIEKHDIDTRHSVNVMKTITVEDEELSFRIGDGVPHEKRSEIVDVTPSVNDINDLIYGPLDHAKR